MYLNAGKELVVEAGLSGFHALSDFDKGWVVGLMDGEGCPTVCGRSPRISCEMNDLDTIIRLNTLIPATQKILTRPPRKSDNVSYMWTYGGKKSLLLMLDLYPYLSERRQARIQEIILEHGG